MEFGEEDTLQRKIRETVTEILKKANMDEMTEFKVRNIASDKLGINLSLPELKQFVRNILESFLLSMEDLSQPVAAAKEPPPSQPTEEEIKTNKEAEEKEEEEEVEAKESKPNIDEDEHALGVICNLTKKKKVAVQQFNGTTLVAIRDYYRKDGKTLPSKGISLPTYQWSAFRNAFPAIEEAIKIMEAKLG